MGYRERQEKYRAIPKLFLTLITTECDAPRHELFLVNRAYHQTLLVLG